jgi:hypothetical protein
MPKLAPQIGLMVKDLFGIDYSDEKQLSRIGREAMLSISAQVWLAAWKNRTTDEWKALARKYNFRLVLSHSDAPLDLPKALQGQFWTLYTIPLE